MFGYSKLPRALRHRGFTLIELLVVIAIIAILAAILFPVFARAREMARRTSCLSNCKQLGLGVMQYLQDYDERFPINMYGGYSGTTNVVQTNAGMPGAIYESYNSAGNPRGFLVTWMDCVYPYVKNLQVFVCPSAQSTTISSYGYSCSVGGYAPANPAGRDIPIASADIRQTSTSMLLMDYNYQYHAAARPDLYKSLSQSTAATSRLRVNPHMDGANVTFTDGHAKWYKGDNAIFSPFQTTQNPFWNGQL